MSEGDYKLQLRQSQLRRNWQSVGMLHTREQRTTYATMEHALQLWRPRIDLQSRTRRLEMVG